MLTHSFWFLIVNALAVFRLVALVTKDTITQPFRQWLGHPFTVDPPQPMRGARWWLFELSTCPWCISIWIAAGVVVLTRFVPGAWQYAALWLALSGAAGFLAER